MWRQCWQPCMHTKEASERCSMTGDTVHHVKVGATTVMQQCAWVATAGDSEISNISEELSP
eukprot:30382-Eustigmatos_ZCMA.PRE.1